MRLVEAALDLFEERGYDDTSVKQIAERAGLTRTTFFRQFADKREVLSAGQDEHTVLLSDSIARSSPSATPLRAVEGALVELAATFPPERRAFAARVNSVTASHDELRERSSFKYAGYASAMRTALSDREVSDIAAAIASDLGLIAFRLAFERWTSSEGPHTLEELVRDSVNECFAASLLLDAGGST